MRRVLSAVAAACCALLVTVAWADDEKPAAEKPAAEKPAAEIEALVKKLDADRFADRQAATTELAKLGPAAIPALEKAALGDSREARTRAVELIKRQYDGSNADAKAAAKDALQRIAKSDSPAAKFAEQALKPKNTPPARPNNPFGGRLPIQIQGGNIQIQIGGAGNRRVVMRNVNGVKEIDATENGQRVKIKDDPNNGIKIEVTEKNKEGKQETKKYEAKNADELKKKHPEAHKLYEKYSKQPAVQVRGIRLQPGALPVPRQIQRAAVPRIESRSAIAKRLDQIKEDLKKATERLKKLDTDSDAADAIKKSLEELEKTRKQVEEARAKVWPR